MIEEILKNLDKTTKEWRALWIGRTVKIKEGLFTGYLARVISVTFKYDQYNDKFEHLLELVILDEKSAGYNTPILKPASTVSTDITEIEWS